MKTTTTPPTDLQYLAPWIRDQVVSVYLKGRDKPMTGCYVCAVYPHVLLARANGSTHLFPAGNICCVRFSPDSEPARNPKHPLHEKVRYHRGHEIQGNRDIPTGPKTYDRPQDVRNALPGFTARRGGNPK